MAKISFASSLLLLSGTACAQQLNEWRQRVIWTGGSPGHSAEFAFDGSVETYTAGLINTTARFGILHNGFSDFAGLYVQSSGEDDFITDYLVTSYLRGANPYNGVVGKVCGATSNFTVITFEHPLTGEPRAWTDMLFLEVSASRNGSYANIHEIYPIYSGDPILELNNTSECAPPPAPSTTSAIPTPTPTPTPAPLPLTPSRWKNGTRDGLPTLPFAIGQGSSNLIDYNATTFWSGPAPEQYRSFSLLLNFYDDYQGFYVQAPPGLKVPDLRVNMQANASSNWVTWDGGVLTGATGEFALVRFQDQNGVVGPVSTASFFIFVDSTNDGELAKIAEIYPIYAGEEVVEP